MALFHLTAHLAFGSVSITEHDVAWELWWRLERAFPTAIGARLMPDHCHVLAFAENAEQARRKLRSVIGALRRTRAGSGTRWQPVPEPHHIADPAKAARHSRYLALNPCRAGLVKDPLEWIWSTHRDVVGAIARPWVDVSRLARALDRPDRGFVRWFHRYVSSDPDVSVTGTALPTRPTDELGMHGIARLLAAALATTRARPEDVARRGPTRSLFIALAGREGWSTQRIADVCRMTPRAVRYRLAHSIDTSAASLCLSDERLCRPYAAAASRYVRRRLRATARETASCAAE